MPRLELGLLPEGDGEPMQALGRCRGPSGAAATEAGPEARCDVPTVAQGGALWGWGSGGLGRIFTCWDMPAASLEGQGVKVANSAAEAGLDVPSWCWPWS